MKKQNWLLVVFVLVAVVVGVDQLKNTKNTETVTKTEVTEETIQPPTATLEAAPETVNGTTTVTTEPPQTQVKKEVPTEAELKDVRFCVAKNVQECKVCLTPKCAPKSGTEVACYTQTSNCVEGKSQRRLSKSEVANFAQILEHNFTW